MPAANVLLDYTRNGVFQRTITFTYHPPSGGSGCYWSATDANAQLQYTFQCGNPCSWFNSYSQTSQSNLIWESVNGCSGLIVGPNNMVFDRPNSTCSPLSMRFYNGGATTYFWVIHT
jgi:hypothetical protein